MEREELPDEHRCNRTMGGNGGATGKSPTERSSVRFTTSKAVAVSTRRKSMIPSNSKESPTKPRNQESLHQIQEIRAKRSNKTPNPTQKSSRKGKLEMTIDVSETFDEALKKMKLKRGDLQLELIREFLKRQVGKKKERQL